jgi:16S rRNA (cytosine967-C5)-methyltransferase
VGLDSRDAGLATEIVFGVLRYQAQLDYLIALHSGRARKLDPEVRLALRIGIYQLRYLDRVPAHAAVGDSVELVRRARKTSAAGLVNALLRKAAADRADKIEWPSREIALSCPEWLLARWERQYGSEAAEGIARAALEEPGKYRHGERFQDVGSQSIVPLLEIEPGQRVLDVCAAPGNKTAQAVEAGARVTAADLHFHRLAQVRGITADLVQLDATCPLPFSAGFERVLVDAPCSGTGTLARNPEIKWRLKVEDLADLAGRQRKILTNALAALAPGGRLVYATCSLEAEENRAVVEEVVAQARGLRIAATCERLPGREAGDGFLAAVIKSEQPAND